MTRMLSTLGLLLAATGAAIAQAGPSTFDRPCAASRDLVVRDGADRADDGAEHAAIGT